MTALQRWKTGRLLQAFKARRDCTECTDAPVVAAIGDDVNIFGIMAPIGEPTGDGRQLASGFTLEFDPEVESPPIIWDVDNNDHDGVIIGRVDSVANTGSALEVTGRLFGSDDADHNALVNRATALIAENAIGWSMSLDDEVGEVEIKETPIEETREGNVVIKISRDSEMMTLESARLRHLALVDTPAWPVARPQLGTPPAIAAAAQVATYPVSHFEKWESRTPVPIQVTADGHVFGHAAGDGCFRDGTSTCRKYTPDPDPQLKSFHTGTTTLDDGTVIRTGVLTCANLHADPSMTHAQQRQYHENTSTVWAKVIAWTDSRGRLCVSGSVVPGLDKTTLAQVAGAPISVELWPTDTVSGLTLVGAHSVPTPAWPVAASGYSEN